MATYSNFNEQHPRQAWEGIDVRVINGQRLTMALVDLAPNMPVQEHHHENEQVGFILQGQLTFTIGGEAKVLGPGDTYNIPSHVPHSAVTGPEGCVAVDVFAPVRADWEALQTSDPHPSAWEMKP